MNEVELLFSEALGCDRASLYLNRDRGLSEDQSAFISAALKRRIKGEPIQYILGKTEFMGLELKVNPSVLIPRPETEILVETALSYIKKEKPARILDLGTGSGCIAISLFKNLLDCEIDAGDISTEALELAGENACLHGAKINFIRSDLFGSLKNKEYGIIISNPPYVEEEQIIKLQPELQFEPRIALAAGTDGLSFYRQIVSEAGNYLKKNGLLIMEIGFGQAKALGKLFSEANNKLKLIEIIKDYNNIDRVIVARKAD